MSTFAQAASALRKAAVDIEQSAGRSVADATRELSALILVGQARAGASSGRLRGVGRSGARIGVKGTVSAGAGLVRATGPAHLLDHPTKPHSIVAKRGKAILTPAGPRRSAQHPGTSGKFYFEEAVDVFQPGLLAIFALNAADAVRDL